MACTEGIFPLLNPACATCYNIQEIVEGAQRDLDMLAIGRIFVILPGTRKILTT